MKPKSNIIICWRTFMHLPTHSRDYGKLSIEIMPLARPKPGEYKADSPVPVYLERYNSAEKVTINYQCNHSDKPEHGYIDGQRWYGEKMELTSERITGTSLVLGWLKRHSPDERLYGPKQVVDLLDAKAHRVAYSCAFGELVDAHRWEDAEKFIQYMDMGASEESGCSVLGIYIRPGMSDDWITREMSKALRSSKHCSDARFAKWVSEGSQWKAIDSRPAAHHQPHTLVEILGTPITDAAGTAA
jgi:hypothetical protein